MGRCRGRRTSPQDRRSTCERRICSSLSRPFAACPASSLFVVVQSVLDVIRIPGTTVVASPVLFPYFFFFFVRWFFQKKYRTRYVTYPPPKGSFVSTINVQTLLIFRVRVVMVLMYLRRVRNFFIWLSVSFLFLVKIRFRGGVYGFSTIDAC